MVSIRDKDGLSNDASGSVRSSNAGSPSGGSCTFGEGWRRIKDAGVAGCTPWPFFWLPLAMIAGECVTEPGLGGGPISVGGSGESEEPISELSALRGTSSPLEDGRVEPDLCASSTNSLTSLGGMNEDTVAFRRPGFTTGDCRTRFDALVERGALLLLLRSRLPCSGCAIAASPSISTSISAGDVPVELPDALYWPCEACADC